MLVGRDTPSLVGNAVLHLQQVQTGLCHFWEFAGNAL